MASSARRWRSGRGGSVDVKGLGCHAYATAGHTWLMGPRKRGILCVSRDAVGLERIPRRPRAIWAVREG